MKTEQMIDALKFYQELAALARKATRRRDQDLLIHVMKQMSLDDGRRAKKAIAEAREE